MTDSEMLTATYTINLAPTKIGNFGADTKLEIWNNVIPRSAGTADLPTAQVNLIMAYNAFGANPGSPITIHIDNADNTPSKDDSGVIHIPLTWIAPADAAAVKAMFRAQAGFTMKGWMVAPTLAEPYYKIYNDTENDRADVQALVTTQLAFAPNDFDPFTGGKKVKICITEGGDFDQGYVANITGDGYTISISYDCLAKGLLTSIRSRTRSLTNDTTVVPVDESLITYANPAKAGSPAMPGSAMPDTGNALVPGTSLAGNATMPDTSLADAGAAGRFTPEAA
jgi:hypothetical protein